MAEWNESEHPRDDEGKFTYKNGGNQQSDKQKMQNRADILFSSMANKGQMTGGAGEMKNNNEYIKKLQNMAETNSDKNFLKNLEFVLNAEGGYNNIKGDVPTNYGVTQRIYDIYRKEKDLPVQSVKYIKIEEVIPVYYKYFWKPSGAEKLSHPLDLVYFDMYINSNPKETKNVLNHSNNDVYQFIENRRKFYDEVIKAKPIKEKFRKGWNNRLDKLKEYVDKYYKNNENLKNK